MPTSYLPHSLRTAPLLLLAMLMLLVLPAAASAAAPTITIGPVDCNAGGSIVTASVASGPPVRLRLLRDSKLVGTMIVPAGAPVTHVVEVAEGTASRIDVRHVDVYTSAFVRRECSGSQAPVAAAVAAATSANTAREDPPYVAGPVVPATGVRANVPTATSATPQDPVEATATAELPSPIRTWALLLIGVVALLAAGIVATTARGNARREREGRSRSGRTPTV